jgi:hypothetical protein
VSAAFTSSREVANGEVQEIDVLSQVVYNSAYPRQSAAIIPILGASKLIQFKDNLACNGLLATELQRLE